MTEEEIISLARKNERIFYVKPDYRSYKLRRKLNSMCNRHIFFHDKNWKKYGAYGDYYILKQH